MKNVASWSFEEKLEGTLRRTLPKLGPEARAQLAALINRQSLEIMGGVLVAWVAFHAFGLGEIIDVCVAVLGAASIGWSVFSGIDYLYDFAVMTYRAKSESNLDTAAEDLAKAIGILGIQAVLAVVFRGAKAPRTDRGASIEIGTEPVRTTGLRYKPTINEDPSLPAGQGVTSPFGDIDVSTQGSATDRAIVLLHEKVHQFLVPKLYILRHYRVSNRTSSYVRSSLSRYIEEALAETLGQVGNVGIRGFLTGVRFPVSNGYMFLVKGGAAKIPEFAGWGGGGLIPEAAGLLYNGVVAGIAFQLWHGYTGAPRKAVGKKGK